MRLKALMLVGMIAALPALGQGTLTFSTTPTYVKTPAAGALVSDGVGGAAATGSTFWAQLYYSTTAGGTFAAFGTPRNFLAGAGAGYISGGTVLVPGVAEGATLQQAAQLMVDLGCVEALNLDGGGSSCMLINGKETIKPSDKGVERPVPAVFLILQKHR